MAKHGTSERIRHTTYILQHLVIGTFCCCALFLFALLAVEPRAGAGAEARLLAAAGASVAPSLLLRAADDSTVLSRVKIGLCPCPAAELIEKDQEMLTRSCNVLRRDGDVVVASLVPSISLLRGRLSESKPST